MTRVPGTYRNPRRTLFVLASIPDGASTDLKNALAIRNACAVDGVCPACHAAGRLTNALVNSPSVANTGETTPDPDPDHDHIAHLTFRHEPWCPCLRDDEDTA